MKFLASIILFGMLLLAQGKALDHGGALHTPCSATCIDAPAYLEHVLASVRARIERGAATYPEALEAESRLLQEQIATGLDQDGEIMKRLQAVYQELISNAQLLGDKEKALSYHIKLLKTSSLPNNREARLDSYRQTVEYERALFQRGLCAYDRVLLAEIAYLQVYLTDPAPEKKADELRTAAGMEICAYLEQKLALVRARIERGAATYPEALEAESRLLQEQIATGLDQDGEIMKRLQTVYQELISYAERAYDKAAAITYRLKLLDVTSPSDHRAAVIDCYRQLVEFRQQQLQHGAGTQDLLLLAEIDYLLASLPERSSEQQEIDKKEIQKKRRLLEMMYEAYHQPK